MALNTILVEDEIGIRQGLKLMLQDIDGINIIYETGSIQAAKQFIESNQLDLILLDIQLEDGNSFELLDILKEHSFSIIFITAYDEYAIKAFKYSAIDYLLKPIDPEELEQAIAKVKASQELVEMVRINSLKQNLNEINQIVIRTTEGHLVIPFADLIYCKADEGYTHFHTKDGKIKISSKPLKEYNKLLPEEQFIRIHQSYLVNINYIEKYTSPNIYLKNQQTCLPVATRRKTAVLAILNKIN